MILPRPDNIRITSERAIGIAEADREREQPLPARREWDSSPLVALLFALLEDERLCYTSLREISNDDDNNNNKDLRNQYSRTSLSTNAGLYGGIVSAVV